MNTKEPQQMPILSEDIGAGNPQRKYYSVDEALAYLEPRIRAMFR